MSDLVNSNFDFLQEIIETEPDEYLKKRLSEIQEKSAIAEAEVSTNREINYDTCLGAIDIACDRIAKLYMEKLHPIYYLKNKYLCDKARKNPSEKDIWKNGKYSEEWENNKSDLSLYLELFHLRGERNQYEHGGSPFYEFPETRTDEEGRIWLQKNEKKENEVVLKTGEYKADPKKYETLQNALHRFHNMFDYLCTVLVKCGYISRENLPTYKEPRRRWTVTEETAVRTENAAVRQEMAATRLEGAADVLTKLSDDLPKKFDGYKEREELKRNYDEDKSNPNVFSEDEKGGKGNRRASIPMIFIAVVIIAFIAVIAISRVKSLNTRLTSANNQEVYYSKIIPYTQSGQYESYKSSSDVTTTIDVNEAFALLSFIKNDSPKTAVVEDISCEFEEITEIIEPNVKVDAVIVDNILKVYVLNDGQGPSSDIDIDIRDDNTELDDFTTMVQSNNVDSLQPGEVDKLAEYTFDPNKYMQIYPDGSSTLTVYINNSPETEVIIQYDPVTDEFSTPGGIGDGGGSITLFSVLDVDSKPKSISFSTDDITTIDDALRIETVIAPTKSCNVVFKGVYSVNGETKETEVYTASVHVPIYAKDVFEHQGIMTQEMAEDSNNSKAHLLQIAKKYLYDPEELNPQK